jgi:hypothetical protein
MDDRPGDLSLARFLTTVVDPDLILLQSDDCSNSDFIKEVSTKKLVLWDLMQMSSML